jgi:hypothetical protein
MNIHKLEDLGLAPIRDFVNTENFKKGGKVTKQKQSQRQTQIVHIHNAAPRRRKRRAAPRQQHHQPIQLPPQFTSVPSGYIHRPEPPPQLQAIHPQLMSRLDEIEERMRNSMLNQFPQKLDNEENEDERAPVSNLVQNTGKEEANDVMSQIPQHLHDSSSSAAASSSSAAASSSSAAASSSTALGIPWQGVHVYVSRNKALMYNSAGQPKYISEFIKGSPKRIADLHTLYSALDKKGINYNKAITSGF